MTRYWVSLFLILIAACAPRQLLVPAEEERAVREALAERGRVSDIETRFEIVFDRNDGAMHGDAALTIAKNGDMGLRVYTLGFLAMEVVSTDGRTQSTPRLDAYRTAILTKGLRDCFFWWDLADYTLRIEGGAYVLSSADREVVVDRRTLLPERQKIVLEDGKELTVYYGGQERREEPWHPSNIRIEFLRNAVILNIRDMTFRS